jgi:TPR repeat protein
MKNIIVTALFLLLSTSAFACCDESLSDRANFNNCLVEAEQGDAEAQSTLGIMYDHGRGVVQDYKSAHMWFNIAAANGNSKAVENREIIAKEITPSQIKKAQDMAREWMAKHP